MPQLEERPRGNLEPPRRDSERPSFWRRLFGKRVEKKPTVGQVLAEFKRQKTAEFDTVRALTAAERRRIGAMANAAFDPARVNNAAFAQAEQNNAIMRASDLYGVQPIAVTYSRGPIVITPAERAAVYRDAIALNPGKVRFLDVPVADLAERPTAGRVIEWRGKRYRVLAGMLNEDATGARYALQAFEL